MYLNPWEKIIDEEKFLEANKSTANFYWNKSRKISMPYYNRVKLYEKIKENL